MEEKNNTKSKNKILIITLIFIGVIACLIIGGYFSAMCYLKKSAEDCVTSMFESLKTGNKEENKYVDLNEILGEDFSSDSENIDEEMEILFSKLDYKIINVEADLTSATVEVEVYNKNIGNVIKNYFLRLIQIAFSQESTAENMDEEMKQYLQEQMNSDEIEMVTTNLTIKLEKVDKKWSITTESEEILNAILPEFMSQLNAISNILSE